MKLGGLLRVLGLNAVPIGGVKTLSDVGGLFAAGTGARAGAKAGAQTDLGASASAQPKWAKGVAAKIAPGDDFDLSWKRESELVLRGAAEDEEVVSR